MAHQPVAVYPGSFDPIHMGHLAIISRSTQLFPRVVVAILENTGKDAMFTAAERVQMMREMVAGQSAVEVRSFSGLLVSLLREIGATIIIRGMRAMSDFEYEFQMALMNRRLYPQAETVFLTAEEEYTYLSSRLVKEVATLGGDVTGLVPEPVRVYLEQHLGRSPRPG